MSSRRENDDGEPSIGIKGSEKGKATCKATQRANKRRMRLTDNSEADKGTTVLRRSRNFVLKLKRL